MFRRDYRNVRSKIKQSGNVCVYDITIAGEGVGGAFAAGFAMSQLRIHFANDTFHPYLFRYLCGASVGAVIIDFFLKAWYLYDTNETNVLALEFLDICFEFFNFATVRQIFATVDTTDVLALGNAYKLITNLLTTGGVFTRDGIVRLLRCETPELSRFKPYFATNEFDEWRNPRLNNVFITVQSSETSISQIFTGNPRLFKTESKLIQFRQLTPGSWEHIVLCSSGIMGVFEPLKIDGTDYSTDGSSFVSNPMNVPQILHNFSYYNNVQRIFKPMLDYFEITSGDFIIHNDVLNVQNFFETVPSFASSPLKIIQTLLSFATIGTRREYAAAHNYELSSIAYTQPLIADFSTADANEIKGDIYVYHQSILLQPDNQATVLNLKTSDVIVHETLTRDEFERNRCYQINDTYENYCQCQAKYSAIISKNPVSSYIYDARCFIHNDIRCHLIDTNTFVRHLYTFDNNIENIKMFLNHTMDIESWTLRRNAGLLQGNVIYNIYLKRMNMKWGEGTDYNMSAVIQTAYDNFLG